MIKSGFESFEKGVFSEVQHIGKCVFVSRFGVMRYEDEIG